MFRVIINSCLSPSVDRWRNVPSLCSWCSHQDELPSRGPGGETDGHWSGGVRAPSRFGFVRHTVAQGAQQSLWRPESRASYLGRWAAFPDSPPYHHRWARHFGKRVYSRFYMNYSHTEFAPYSLNDMDVNSFGNYLLLVWLAQNGQ